jgi:PilX N-terminal
MTISNERGSALIITLMLLVILTAIGIYAISISTTEMSIALQSRVGTSTLNAADSGANVGIDYLPSIYTTSQAGTLFDNTSYTWTSRATGASTLRAGYGATYHFPDFEVTSQGVAPPHFTGTRGVQVVAIYGPVPMGTMY